jgi:hypothetical protein
MFLLHEPEQARIIDCLTHGTFASNAVGWGIRKTLTRAGSWTQKGAAAFVCRWKMWMEWECKNRVGLIAGLGLEAKPGLHMAHEDSIRLRNDSPDFRAYPKLRIL